MNSNLKRYANTSIKVLVFVFLSWTIYQQVFRNQSWSNVKAYYAAHVSHHAFFLILIVFALMIINWTLESWKWKIIIRPLQTISLWMSIQAILSGITLSIFTPNRIGEFGGRIFFINPINRIKGIFATLIGSLANILAVIIFGVFGVIYQLPFLADNIYLSSSVLIVLGIAGVVLALLIYYNVRLAPKLANKNWFKSRARNVLNVYTRYSFRTLSEVLSLSLFRYLTFVTQYIILLGFFGIKLDLLLGLSKVGLIYLAQTIIPSIAVAELGIRGNVALFFLNDVVYNEDMKIGIVSATFTLWLINLIIPALFGAFFILRLKFFKNK